MMEIFDIHLERGEVDRLTSHNVIFPEEYVPCHKSRNISRKSGSLGSIMLFIKILLGESENTAHPYLKDIYLWISR